MTSANYSREKTRACCVVTIFINSRIWDCKEKFSINLIVIFKKPCQSLSNTMEILNRIKKPHWRDEICTCSVQDSSISCYSWFWSSRGRRWQTKDSNDAFTFTLSEYHFLRFYSPLPSIWVGMNVLNRS